MKDNQKKRAFITARAEGKSYEQIAKDLGISKSTCTKWSKDLEEEITTLQEAQREEIITTYKMQKEARINGLTAILEKIDTAIEEIDFKELSPRELLNLKLQYTRAIREETPEPIEVIGDSDINTIQGIIGQLNFLLLRAGQIPPATLKANIELLKAKKDILEDYAILVSNDTNYMDFRTSAITYNDILLRGGDTKEYLKATEEIEEAY